MNDRVAELQAELAKYPQIMRGGGRFDPKLNFQERCEILALYLNGISRRTLSVAYGLDRRTIAHIYNDKSVHYKSVRLEYQALGKDEFLRRYLTESAVERTKKAATDPRVTLADVEYRQERIKDQNYPRKNRNKYAGVNRIKPAHCEHTHAIDIQWREQVVEPDGTVLPAGWWYQDLEGKFPDQWFRGDDASLVSSEACLQWCEEFIEDPIEE